jgi:hypothetical protein
MCGKKGLALLRTGCQPRSNLALCSRVEMLLRFVDDQESRPASELISGWGRRVRAFAARLDSTEAMSHLIELLKQLVPLRGGGFEHRDCGPDSKAEAHFAQRSRPFTVGLVKPWFQPAVFSEPVAWPEDSKLQFARLLHHRRA